jgi:hypothetical protein
MRLAGGLGTRNAEIVPLASFLKDTLSPRVPLKTRLVLLLIVRPKQLDYSAKVAVLTKTTTFWAKALTKRNKLDGGFRGSFWPDNPVLLKTLAHD